MCREGEGRQGEKRRKFPCTFGTHRENRNKDRSKHTLVVGVCTYVMYVCVHTSHSLYWMNECVSEIRAYLAQNFWVRPYGK